MKTASVMKELSIKRDFNINFKGLLIEENKNILEGESPTLTLQWSIYYI